MTPLLLWKLLLPPLLQSEKHVALWLLFLPCARSNYSPWFITGSLYSSLQREVLLITESSRETTACLPEDLIPHLKIVEFNISRRHLEHIPAECLRTVDPRI